MVLILGRRLNREESVMRDSPAVKRKVLPNNPNVNLISISLSLSSSISLCTSMAYKAWAIWLKDTSRYNLTKSY